MDMKAWITIVCLDRKTVSIDELSFIQTRVLYSVLRRFTEYVLCAILS